MKLSKMFLAGIPALALVFGLTLVGCDDGSTTDPAPTAPAAGSNSLTGSWVNNRTTPTQAFIFTDVDAATAGAKVAYWSTNLSAQTTAASGTVVYINNVSYSYSMTDTNTLTVTAYGVDAAGNVRNVPFKRAPGTSGSSMYGIWISNLPPSDNGYTLLIIRSNTAATLTTVGQGSWGETYYSLMSDATGTSIKWSTGNYVLYNRYSGTPDTLDLPPPPLGAGQAIANLYRMETTAW
jgi:hypothetical protein